MSEPTYDEDALVAGVDLVGRTGATDFEVGYLHDDVPVAEAGWYAKAQYRGARLTAEDHPGPVEAVEALARRLLKGALCKCRRRVTLAGSQGDGSKCRWTRVGRRWTSECESWAAPPQPMTMKRRGEPWSALS